MNSTTEYLNKLLKKNLPDIFRYEVSQILRKTYKESHSYTLATYDKGGQEDAAATDRRARLEKNLRELVEDKFPSMEVESRKNVKKSSNYILIKSGEVYLTISAVNCKGEKPHPAYFRANHLKDSQNYFAFTEKERKEQELAHNPDLVYAQLIHGPKSGNSEKVEFAQLAVADKTSKKFVFLQDIRLDGGVDEQPINPVQPNGPTAPPENVEPNAPFSLKESTKKAPKKA